MIGSDASWLAGRGPVLSADLYDGETFDARLRSRGWAETGAETGAGTDSLQPAVVVDGFDPAVLVAPDGPPVRATDELPVRAVLGTPSGKTILDFGQNLVAGCVFNVSGAAGTEVVLRHAEVLEHGELGVRPLRVPSRPTRYILRGDPAARAGSRSSPSTGSATWR